MKHNQKGSAVEILLLAIVVIVIIGGGLWVYNHHSTSSTSTTTSKKTTSSSSSSTPAGPNQAQYAGWQSFCSSYGGLCLKYPATWKLSQVTNPPGQSADGQEVDTFTSPSGNVEVVYMPSAQVTGSRRQEAIQVVGVTPTALSTVEVVSLIDQVSGSSSQYAVEDFVTLTSAAHAINSSDSPFKTGATISSSYEPPYHQFTNPERPSDIGQTILAVTEKGGNPAGNVFSSSSDAEAWLNSSEVQTAGQILDSVTFSQ